MLDQHADLGAEMAVGQVDRPDAFVGWPVLGQDRDQITTGYADAIETALKAIETVDGATAHYNGSDLPKSDEIDAMMKDAAAKFGGIDILINNAGIQYTAIVDDFPVEKWGAVIAINLSSVFHTTRLAVPAPNWSNARSKREQRKATFLLSNPQST
ncbi:MAG: SDR family NAD(P)-dependent oxidoreductase [Thalassospira sp.]|uniref:SDR family NAD(P)-dependent oxidoreductase n=1 Tax=Thalassospira sp. TaxID=1912094 RepID=UPI003A8393D7